MEFNSLGKMLIIVGLGLFCLGLFLVFFQKLPFWGKLPGDILVKKGNFTFYFPLTTSIILSLVVSALLLFFKK